MTFGLSDNLQQVSDAQKTAVINNELCRLQVDIIALQETRLPESGIIRALGYSFFWHSKAADETREHDIILPSEVTERLLKLQLQTSAGLVSLISAYAPPLKS